MSFTTSLNSFWLGSKMEVPIFPELALLRPLPVCITFLGKVAFSELMISY